MAPGLRCSLARKGRSSSEEKHLALVVVFALIPTQPRPATSRESETEREDRLARLEAEAEPPQSGRGGLDQALAPKPFEVPTGGVQGEEEREISREIMSGDAASLFGLPRDEGENLSLGHHWPLIPFVFVLTAVLRTVPQK